MTLIGPYFSTFSRMPPPVTGLLLDTYPNAAFAYSFRKLGTAYAGSAIRLRAGGSNVETNIGFSGNDFDTAAATLAINIRNLLTFSQRLDNAAWQLNSATIAANDTTAPDGTSTAEKLTAANANNVHYVSHSFTITTGINYTMSIYAKQNTHRYIVWQTSDGVNSGKGILVDLQTGTILSTGITIGSDHTYVDSSISSAGSGWYRISFTFNSTEGSQAPLIEIRPDGSDTSWSPSWAAAGTEAVHLWGAQMEVASSPTTYQQTDSAINDGNGYIVTWYDQSGNANNAVQATTSAQPKYVASAFGSLPGIDFDCVSGGTSRFLTVPDSATFQYGTGDLSVFNVAIATTWNDGASGGTEYPFVSKDYTGFEFWSYLLDGSLHCYVGGASNPVSGAASALSNGTGYTLQTNRSGSSLKCYINGTQTGSTATNNANASNIGQDLYLGTRPGGGFSARETQGELISWGASQSANLAAITSDMKTYWGV